MSREFVGEPGVVTEVLDGVLAPGEHRFGRAARWASHIAAASLSRGSA
jgi:hypothetical protein